MKTTPRFPFRSLARLVLGVALAGFALTSAAAQDAMRMARGKQIYQGACLACHLAEGEGMPDLGVPPLAGTDFFSKDKSRSIRILLNGIVGPIAVNGHPFNGFMTDLPMQLTFGLPDTSLDDRIADVLTYAMNSWGNRYGTVTPDEVVSIRAGDSVYRIRPLRLSEDEHPATTTAPAPVSPAMRSAYISMCANCHREDGGQGLQRSIPPLAGSDFLSVDKERSIRLLITGMRGPMVVNNRSYNSLMPVQVFSDQQIADLVNYELNAWGNNFGTVTTADVAKVRAQN
jgi:mono/diheme cytochrome c family protein